ncbi:MAG: PrsW family intramembrane metalloprotease [Lachnospiraceae bacterium]|nr:PrsW family intramembrane metalloprotease [Lachnospiraceae bacterium]
MLTTLALELAVIPGIILFIFVWRNDRIEKEPAKLLWILFFLGALTILSAMLIGMAGEYVVTMFMRDDTMLFVLIDNFILTALVEEGGKYFVLKKKTWKDPAFNYTYDAVMYAVTVSLGFAVAENILYVSMYGIGTAVVRALTAVPSHVIDGIFMGCYYGYAKKASAWGNKPAEKSNLRLALIIPVLLHGFYDFCLSTGYDIFILIFWIFDITMVILAYKRLKKMSADDTPIYY